jgi:hypothetical protein
LQATHTGLGTGSSFRLQEGFETIVDYPDIKGFIDKPVDHQRQFCDRIFDPTHTREDALLTAYFYETDGPHPHWYNWGPYGQIRMNEVLVTYPKSRQQLAREALHKLHTINEVDNLTNIVEAPSFITGLKELGHLIDKALFGGFNKSPRTSGASRAGALLSGGWLYWSFGVAPLISDIKKISSNFSRLSEDMKRFNDSVGKVVKTRSRCRGTLTVTPTTSGYGQPYDTNTWWHLRPIGLITPPTRIVTVTGIRDRTKFSNGAVSKLQYLAERYLSAGPASFVWERIPYSFVVDWFVDLSSVVDAIDQVYTGRSDIVQSICASENWSISADVERHHVYSWTSDSEGYVTVHNELKHYQREPIDRPSWVGLNSNFGKRQALHSAALLHQLVAKLRSYKSFARLG